MFVGQTDFDNDYIDWDGVTVTALPRTLGNERYSRWLTRDWDSGHVCLYRKSMEYRVECGWCSDGNRSSRAWAIYLWNN